ncbi:MAG: hypothetical protein ACOCRK_06090 [bacterium]
MNELELFVELCTKDELTKLVEKYNVKINGFNKNFNNAPNVLLRNSIKNDFSKKGNKKFNHILTKNIPKMKIIEEQDINLYILKANKYKNFIPESKMFLKFLSLFPETKGYYLPRFIENKKSDKFIFDLELKNLNLNDNNANDLFLSLSDSSNAIDKFYESYKDDVYQVVINDNSVKEYDHCFNEVKDVSWLDFVKKYIKLIKNHDETLIYMAYLDANQKEIQKINDMELKYIHSLIMYEIILNSEYEEKNIFKKKCNKLSLENQLLKTEKDNLFNKAIKLEGKIKEIVEDKKKTKNELDNKIKKLQDDLNYEKEKIKDIKKVKKAVEKELEKAQKNHKKEIDNLSNEIGNHKSLEDYFVQWGYQSTKSNIIIFTYEDSKLYKLFFDQYMFINSTHNIFSIKNQLSQCTGNTIIVINKVGINTKKLLELEKEIETLENEHKIMISLSFSPISLITDIINKFGEEL